jgi:hypothetical protein
MQVQDEEEQKVDLLTELEPNEAIIINESDPFVINESIVFDGDISISIVGDKQDISHRNAAEYLLSPRSVFESRRLLISNLNDSGN